MKRNSKEIKLPKVVMDKSLEGKFDQHPVVLQKVARMNEILKNVKGINAE